MVKRKAGKRKASDEVTETLNGTHVNEVNVDEIEDSDDTTGRVGGAPLPNVNFRRTSFLWRARWRRAAMAMPPICRRPGCR